MGLLDEPCPTCGEYHPDCFRDLLFGLYLMARQEAESRLSPQGGETLKMVEHATDALGVVDAYDSAEALEDLPQREVRVIEVFLARKTLIDAMQGQEGDDTEHEQH